MWRYCANCDDLVRKTVYVAEQGSCCLSCAEYFGTKSESDDFDFSDNVAVVEPQNYPALAEMQGRVWEV